MKLSDFDFELPEELIAQHPCERRDESRLMVLHKNTGEIEHRHFYDIIDYLHPGFGVVLAEKYKGGPRNSEKAHLFPGGLRGLFLNGFAFLSCALPSFFSYIPYIPYVIFLEPYKSVRRPLGPSMGRKARSF